MISLNKKSSLRFLNIYFQVHQPRRLKYFSFFDVGSGKSYFNDKLNEEIIRRISDACYLPSNRIIQQMLDKYPNMRITFSISGTTLEQLEKFAPEVIQSFRRLADTGSVEFLAETYYHSLAFLISNEEFIYQVEKHRAKIFELFNVYPTVFRNTELIYSDDIGKLVSRTGFNGTFMDAVKSIMGDRNIHQLYQHVKKTGPRIFIRDYKLSDDIAFRYSDRKWKEWPLSAKRYVQWLEKIPGEDPLINLALDYETFGEHHKKNTGIFNFLKELLLLINKNDKIKMLTPSEAIKQLLPKGMLSVPGPVSWADNERDLSAWLGNDMQKEAFNSMKKLKYSIVKMNNQQIVETWRYLQTSDHFYYMSTKKNDDGDVHSYFSHYRSPYEAFINYMNVISDLIFQLDLHKYLKSSVRKVKM